MLIEYIEEALRHARYELIDDEDPYHGEINDLPGVWACGKTLEERRQELKNIVEGWLLVSVKRELVIPALGDYRVESLSETE